MKRRIVIIAAVVVGLLASPWILGAAWMAGGTVYGKIDQWRYQRTAEFRDADWKRPNRKYRYAVLDHVAAKVVSAGMKEEEVERLLGKPDSVSEKKGWQYETKRRGWYFIDFSGGGLLVEFDSQRRVVRVSKNLWVD